MHNPKNTKILIIEDDVIIAEYISEILQEEQFKNVEIVNDANTAMSEMKTFVPDIILMDINLSGKNEGITLSKNKNDNAAVIFITGQQDFALMSEAIKTKPYGYLTKPIKKVDLMASISIVIHKNEDQSFQFKDGYDTVNLKYTDIRYFVAEGNYSNIYTTSKKFSIRQSLSTIADQLPSHTFVRAHRSFLVNKNKVERISTKTLEINNVEIPLSRTYAKHFK
ncbi:LytR/AlgR family response regulator transcription factor [Winogradskyella psychrotolerans]|uniref:LytR/AlgR family response regulator transcription factor n=1 Tax=Winogradskyella psychrotolerans TaxID=1344585 RepID=UPI001C078B35|nr:response regulator transcription factor [Winogradskyella psychrotolerans]MBU2929003.1 response regulator transcription factor [Winogradskyella psychrotolerans]